MSDETDDVDPEDPRPSGHYPRFRDNEWHYVPDELAQTISLGPGGDGEEGQDWVLTYTPEKRDPADREKILVRLTPRALHELYIEVKDLDVTVSFEDDQLSVDIYLNPANETDPDPDEVVEMAVGAAEAAVDGLFAAGA